MSAREPSPLFPDGTPPGDAPRVIAPDASRADLNDAVIDANGVIEVSLQPDAAEPAALQPDDAFHAASATPGTDDAPGAARTNPEPAAADARSEEPREAIPLDSGVASSTATPPSAPRGYLPALQRHSLRIGEIMLSRGLIGAGDIETVLEEQKAVKARFGEILIARGIADASDVVWALSQQAGAGDGPVMLQAGASEELVMVRQPYGQAAEIIRGLRAQLLSTVLSPDMKPRRALALVSANGGDGKTYLAANLALSLAQLGGRTIVVEADLRTPRLHEVFMLPPGGGGLTGTLSGSHLLRESVAALPDLPNLHLLPAGSAPANPVELLQQPAFSLLLTTLLSQYDHVLVDTAAFDAGTDARVVAERCGMAIALARKGRTRMDSVHATLSQLQRAGVKIAGLVMNAH